MKNQVNHKFTVCWVCMAVIKSICKIVWRTTSVLFVFHWYYNRRPAGAQPTFSLNPNRLAPVSCKFELRGIHSTQKTLPLFFGTNRKCARCDLHLRFLSNLLISQFDLCIEPRVYTFCLSPSFELFSSCPASDLWVIYTGVVWELARAAPSQIALIQSSSTTPSATSISTSTPPSWRSGSPVQGKGLLADG